MGCTLLTLDDGILRLLKRSGSCSWLSPERRPGGLTR